MKIIIVQALAGGKRERLQELTLSADAESRDLAVKQSFNLPDGELLEVSAIHTLISMNLSLFVTHGNQHVATLMCNWRDVAPHFALRLPSGDFIEFYFEK